MMCTPCAAHWVIRGLAMYPQVDVQLQQAGTFLQLLRQQLHGLMLGLVGRTDDHLARDLTVQV